MAVNTQEIKDFGEKIGGAKKDLWKTRGLVEEDLEEFNGKEFAEFVTKKNVWVEPDYKELVRNGMSPVCAYFYKEARATFPNKVEVGKNDEQTKMNAIMYIVFLQQAREVLEQMKVDADVFTAFGKLFRGNGYLEDRSWTDKARINPAISNKTIKFMQLRHTDLEHMQDTVEIMGFPETFRGDLKGVYVSYCGKEVSTGKEVYRIPGLRERFDSRKEAIEYAKEHLVKSLDDKKEKKKKDEKAGIIIRPQLVHIRRTGPEIRNGNIDTEALQFDFGFRGGEFGNWNNQKDRQACINLAYDSFQDLAMVVNIPKEKLAIPGYMNQKLAIAFGARGSGKASAHYEFNRVVINLTKMKGAGSLAHEWGHAFDAFIGCQLGLEEFATRRISPRHINNKRVLEALQNVNDAIRRRPLSREDIIASYEKNLEERRRVADSWYMQCEKSFVAVRYNSNESRTDEEKETMHEMLKRVLDGACSGKSDLECDRMLNEAMDYFKSVKGRVYPKEERATLYHCMMSCMGAYELLDEARQGKRDNNTGQSNYLTCAKKLDSLTSKSKVYYAEDVELFARAFESFVEDTLGFENGYLVHSTHRVIPGFTDYPLSPYPMGEERQRINKAIRELIDVIREEFMGGESYQGERVLSNGKSKRVEVHQEENSQVDATSENTEVKVKEPNGNTLSIEKKVEEDKQAKEKKPVVERHPKETKKENKSEVQEAKKQANEEHNKDSRGKMINSINTSKELRECLSNVKRIPLPINDRNIANYAKLVNNQGIIYGPVPYRKRCFNSKAIGINGNTLVVCSDSNVKIEKQIEGLVEATVRKFVKAHNENELVSEAATLCVCKQLGLNVKTYCLREEYDRLVKNKQELGKFLRSVSITSSYVKDVLRLKVPSNK